MSHLTGANHRGAFSSLCAGWRPSRAKRAPRGSTKGMLGTPRRFWWGTATPDGTLYTGRSQGSLWRGSQYLLQSWPVHPKHCRLMQRTNAALWENPRTGCTEQKCRRRRSKGSSLSPRHTDAIHRQSRRMPHAASRPSAPVTSCALRRPIPAPSAIAAAQPTRGCARDSLRRVWCSRNGEGPESERPTRPVRYVGRAGVLGDQRSPKSDAARRSRSPAA